MLKVYSIYTIYPPDLVRQNTILWIRIKLLMSMFSTQVDKTREINQEFHVELQIRKHFPFSLAEKVFRYPKNVKR